MRGTITKGALLAVLVALLAAGVYWTMTGQDRASTAGNHPHEATGSPPTIETALHSPNPSIPESVGESILSPEVPVPVTAESNLVPNESAATMPPSVVLDPAGYILFCPCMGRFGNQIDYILGMIRFSWITQRILVLPKMIEYGSDRQRGPWRELHEMNEYFNLTAIKAFTKAITTNQFLHLLQLQPDVATGGITTLCPAISHEDSNVCPLRNGQPSTDYWDHIFGRSNEPLRALKYQPGMDLFDGPRWKSVYPSSEHPVIMFTGVPVPFPVNPRNRELQRLLVWNDSILSRLDRYEKKFLSGPEKSPWISAHIRRGSDWVQACKMSIGMSSFMASTQCLQPGEKIQSELCLPSFELIAKEIEAIARKTKAKSLFVGTDDPTVINELKKYFTPSATTTSSPLVTSSHPLIIRGLTRPNPQFELALMGSKNSMHFIGNGVSSFSGFVKRQRDVEGSTSSFFGYPYRKNGETITAVQV